MSIQNHEDGSVTVTLKYPAKADGLVVKEVTFRRPKNKDYMLLDKQRGSEREKNNWLMVHLAEPVGSVTPGVIEELDVYDLAIINQAFADFLPEDFRQRIFA